MATIKLKNGTGAPLASDLVQGEPALDLTNKRLYTEDTLGAVIEVGVNPTELNVTGDITVGGTVDGRDIATDGAKLDGVESGATADQTAAEIRTLVDSATDSNVFTDADHTKLDGVEALADVTDTTNVTAAGAVMDSELTSEASVKALNQGVATTDSPTFAGATINGTVTADGLTVNSGATNTAATFESTDQYAFLNFQDNTSTDGTFIGAEGNNLIVQSDSTKRLFQAEKGGDISFYDTAGTTAKFFWDASAESLGIGNSAPTATLDVTGTVTADGVRSESTDGLNLYTSSDYEAGWTHVAATGTSTLNVGRNATWGGELIIQTDTKNRANFASNGDVSLYEDTGTTAKFFWDASAESLGIGTSSPSAILEVSNAGLSAPRITSSDGLGDAVQRFYSGSTYKGQIGWDQSSDVLGLYGAGGSGVPDLTIDSVGNVGVGTDSPTKEMEIQLSSTTGNTLGQKGGLQFYSTSSTVGNGGEITWQSGTGNTERWCAISGHIVDNGAGGSRGDLVFATKAAITDTALTERMRIDSAGQVGIGTDSPASLVDLKDTTPTLRLTDDRNITWSGNETLGNIEFFSSDTSVSGTHVTGFIKNINDRSGGSVQVAGALTFGVSDYDTAASEAMRISSAGNVGIGTDSPNVYGKTAIKGGEAGTADSNLSLLTNGDAQGEVANLAFYGTFIGTADNGPRRTADITAGFNAGSWGSEYLSFNVGKSGASNDTRSLTNERMRIDSSGNAMFNCTTIDPAGDNVVGSALLQYGGASMSRTNSTTLDLNRSSSDGSILNFRKDGSTVGGIGVDNSDNLTIEGNSSHGGLQIATNVILPHKNGALADNTIGLGNSDNRFTELFLSGGAYLGGTAAANKLDDYEEGTWTPTIIGSTSGSITGFTLNKAVYVKVGDLVHVGVYLANINMTASTCSGTIQLGGLPFTANSFTGSPSVSFCNMFSFDESDVSISGYVSGNAILLHRGSSTTAITDSDEGTSTAASLMFSLTYEAA